MKTAELITFELNSIVMKLNDLEKKQLYKVLKQEKYNTTVVSEGKIGIEIWPHNFKYFISNPHPSLSLSST